MTTAPSTFRQAALRLYDAEPPGYIAEPTGFLLHLLDGGQVRDALRGGQPRRRRPRVLTPGYPPLAARKPALEPRHQPPTALLVEFGGKEVPGPVVLDVLDPAGLVRVPRRERGVEAARARGKSITEPGATA